MYSGPQNGEEFLTFLGPPRHRLSTGCSPLFGTSLFFSGPDAYHVPEGSPVTVAAPFLLSELTHRTGPHRTAATLESNKANCWREL
jgi:hypothetical protein